MPEQPVLRVCALYPDLMNIYADRGNLLLLERRCRWRGIGFELQSSGLGDELDPDGADLYYIGGGQDRDQRLCALDLAQVKRDALHAVAARGGVILAVCGGYQLLGSSYQLDDERLPGVELVDLVTVRESGPRLIGNVAIEVELEPGRSAGPRRLREPWRAHASGARHAAVGSRPVRARQQRRRRTRGRARRQRDRHLSPRPAVAKERLVCRLADRERRWARRRRCRNSTTSSRAPRTPMRSGRREYEADGPRCLLDGDQGDGGRDGGGDHRARRDRRCGGSSGAGTTDTPASSPQATTTSPGTGKPLVTIGDKNTTEQFVLGELYYQALAAKGFKVMLNRNIGPTEVTLKALQSGRLAMYPEYLQTLEHGGGRLPARVQDGGQGLPGRAALRARARPRVAQPDAVQQHRRDRGDGAVRARASPVDGRATCTRWRRRSRSGPRPSSSRVPTACPSSNRPTDSRRPRSSRWTSAASTRRSTQGTVQAADVNTTDGELTSGDYRLLEDPRPRARVGQRRARRLAQAARRRGPGVRRDDRQGQLTADAGGDATAQRRRGGLTSGSGRRGPQVPDRPRADQAVRRRRLTGATAGQSQEPLEPKPPEPRSDSASSCTSTTCGVCTLTITS